MNRNVKGTLFVDYVRMVRTNKAVDWRARLSEQDLPFLETRIEPDAWYPMETFERLGNAVLDEIAGGDLRVTRAWGRMSVDKLLGAHPGVLCPEDPRESLMRFHVLRRSFFDFSAVEVHELHDFEARLEVHYQMGPKAEEAASHQAMGFFEGLLDAAGAAEVEASFESRSWTGEPTTILSLRWQTKNGEDQRLLLPG